MTLLHQGLDTNLQISHPLPGPGLPHSSKNHYWLQGEGRRGKRIMQSATARALPGQGRATQLATLPTPDSSFAHPHSFTKSPELKWPIVKPWQRGEERSSSTRAVCCRTFTVQRALPTPFRPKPQQVEHRHRCRPEESLGISRSVSVLQILLYPACLITGKC